MATPLTANERRAALIGALEHGAELEGWIRRELAESLARTEYARGARDGIRAFGRTARARGSAGYGAELGAYQGLTL